MLDGIAPVALTGRSAQGANLDGVLLTRGEPGQQWFRAPEQSECCARCWDSSCCSRHFGYGVGEHETLFGLIPLASRVSERLLRQVRPWIEPAQSFEKHPLGLGQMFFNSLRLTWQMSLWADSAVLMWTRAWLDCSPSSWNSAWQQKKRVEVRITILPTNSHAHKVAFGTPSFSISFSSRGWIP